MQKLFLLIIDWVVAHFRQKNEVALMQEVPQIAPPQAIPAPIKLDDWLDKLIVGLFWAESRWNENCPIGDKDLPMSKGGPAYGGLQIRGGVLSEINALWGTHYVGKDLEGKFGFALSKKICRDYFLKIAPQYKSYKAAIKAGISKEEVCAKSWNGGLGYFLEAKRRRKEDGEVEYQAYMKRLDMYWATVKSKL